MNQIRDSIILIIGLLLLAWLSEPRANIVEHNYKNEQITHYLPYDKEPYKEYDWEKPDNCVCWDD